MRKKILSLIIALLLSLPAVCFAAVTPTITSDSRTFNPLTGVYELTGNVFVQFPIKGTDITIVADYAKVQMYQLEVHGNGGIKLNFGDIGFTCDKVDVYGSERTAYMEGSSDFNADGVHITSDSSSYCWKTKLASFSGNVVVNGEAKSGTVYYNIKTRSFN